MSLSNVREQNLRKKEDPAAHFTPLLDNNQEWQMQFPDSQYV